MKTGLKRGIVLGMSVCLAASSLAGCSKEKEFDATTAVASLDGEEVQAGVVNFLLRYQQAQFESTYGSWLKSYYGNDLWNSDLSGTGTVYGDTFKSEIMTSLEKMLLAEKHMADYSVELTDEEKTAISEAAQQFVAANEEDVLGVMSATQENVERVLTLYTIQVKMQEQMSADVDTEVSDEEAAQRTVSYVRFNVKTEEETEAAAEEETGAEEDSSESETEAAVTEADTVKTESADTEAETVPDTEKETAKDETEAQTDAEDSTESGSEEETETETEDEATKAAKAEAQSRAEAFLAVAKEADDFAAAAAEAAEADDNASTSSYTFGDDDTYPDAAIIEATKDLEDDTLVDHVVQVNSSFYVLHVDDAFDEDAVADKKVEIVNQRKQDAINALYDEWMGEVEFTTDEEVYSQLTFNLSLTQETEAATEAEETETVETEAAEAETSAEESTEENTEAVTEAAQEETEAVSEEAAEAGSEAETEAQTDAETEAE